MDDTITAFGQDAESEGGPASRRIGHGHRRAVQQQVRRFFELYQVSRDGMAALGENCRLRRGDRNKQTSISSGRRRSSAVLLVSGCVSVSTGIGAPRLWKGPAFFGNSDIWPHGSYHCGKNPVIVSRGSFVALTIDPMRLAHLAVEEPSVALALVRMGMEQHAIMERVYCGNGDSPVARVAALFEYLMEKRSVPKIIRDGKGQPVVTVSTSTTVDGPTQLDVADALGLGRATVEKAIATLRTEGALVAPARGARTNRLYEIRDRSVLGVMALGLDPSVGPADRDT